MFFGRDHCRHFFKQQNAAAARPGSLVKLTSTSPGTIMACHSLAGNYCSSKPLRHISHPCAMQPGKYSNHKQDAHLESLAGPVVLVSGTTNKRFLLVTPTKSNSKKPVPIEIITWDISYNLVTLISDTSILR